VLTRLEVKGFKNLDVKADFGPFTCIASGDGGKSDVVDAIEFLAHLATGTLGEACHGDPGDIFWYGKRVTITAEMIVPGQVEDDTGTPATPATTRLRYYIALEYDPRESKLVLNYEELRAIPPGDRFWRLRFPHSPAFAPVATGRYDDVFISTKARDGEPAITLPGEPGGEPRTVDAMRAGRTVLSTATADHPTVLAARREMQNWRRLTLDPSALRAPDEFTSPRTIGADGRHLAATLYRIATGNGDEEAVYARVAGRLADLSGARVESLRVEADPVAETFTLYVTEHGGLRLPARMLGDGMLRVLALCVLLEDPTATGLVCLDEPENGIYPADLPAVMRLLKDLAVEPTDRPGVDNPLRQVIISTYSPGLVQLCDPADLLLAETRPRRAPDGRVVAASSVLPYRGSWRQEPGEPAFSKADVIPYLESPPGAHLTIED
jgi:predicted ATPase